MTKFNLQVSSHIRVLFTKNHKDLSPFDCLTLYILGGNATMSSPTLILPNEHCQKSQDAVRKNRSESKTLETKLVDLAVIQLSRSFQKKKLTGYEDNVCYAKPNFSSKPNVKKS